MSKLAFVDAETTGLEPGRHHVWELACILRERGRKDRELCWRIRPDLRTADPNALRVGRYYERMGELAADYVGAAFRDVDSRSTSNADPWPCGAHSVAKSLASLLDGAHLVACNPAFDAGFLAAFLRAHGQAPGWHYRLKDIGSLAQGYQHGRVRELLSADPELDVTDLLPAAPWHSDELSRMIGVDPDGFDRHTALGDARWVRAQWDAITGGGEGQVGQ